MPDFDDQLPDDFSSAGGEGEGIFVNFSKDEAESTGDYKPIPRGEYHCKITDNEVALSKSEKNPGKPMWKMELTVQDGEYENRKLITNVCLWNGALYSLSQIMKAIYQVDIEAGEFRVPAAADLIGKDVIAKVMVKPANDQYDAGNNIKSFKEYTGKAPVGSEASLLP